MQPDHLFRAGDASEAEKEELARRSRLPECILYISVSHNEQPTEAWATPSSETLAARVGIPLKPGTGESTATRHLEPIVCATTARLLSLRKVLELCLIFSGARIDDDEPNSDACASTRALRKVNLHSMQYVLVPRDAASGSTPQQHNERATSTTLKDHQLHETLWTFLQPEVNSDCFIFVRLESGPSATLNTSANLLLQLVSQWNSGVPNSFTKPDQQTIKRKRSQVGKEDPVKKPNQEKNKKGSRSPLLLYNQGVDTLGAKSSLQASTPSHAESNSATTTPSEDTLSTGATTAPLSINEAASTIARAKNRLDADKFRDLTEQGREHKHCDITDDLHDTEAAHIIPATLHAHLVWEVMTSVFGTARPRVLPEHNPHIKFRSLFASGVYPILQDWDRSTAEPQYNGFFLTPSLHRAMDKRFVLTVLQDEVIVLSGAAVSFFVLFMHQTRGTKQRLQEMAIKVQELITPLGHATGLEPPSEAAVDSKAGEQEWNRSEGFISSDYSDRMSDESSSPPLSPALSHSGSGEHHSFGVGKSSKTRNAYEMTQHTTPQQAAGPTTKAAIDSELKSWTEDPDDTFNGLVSTYGDSDGSDGQSDASDSGDEDGLSAMRKYVERMNMLIKDPERKQDILALSDQLTALLGYCLL
ncbi:hypothetical protein OC842_007752, partial [Tilletia horrida]